MCPRRRLVAVLSAAAVGSACATNSAPDGLLPTPEEARTSSYGGWVELGFQGEQGVERIDGELIAVSSDSIWILPPTRSSPGGENQGRTISADAVIDGQLTAWDARHGQVAGGVLAGVLSTISNGVLLVFTAPIWIIGGSIAASHQSKLPQTRLPPTRWEDLTPFTRFPQGIPPEVRLDDLEPMVR